MNKLKEYWEILAIIVGILGLLGIEFSKEIKIRPITWTLRLITFMFSPLKKHILNETTRAVENQCKWGELYQDDRRKLYELEARYNNREMAVTRLEQSQLAFLSDKILYQCMKHIKAKKIDRNELKVLLMLHKSYKDLGGNSFIDEMMEKVKLLEVV